MVIRKRPVAIELRLKAEAEARKEAVKRFKHIAIRFFTGLLAFAFLIFVLTVDVLAREDYFSGLRHEIIEEVHEQQLEKVVTNQDFVGVFWYARKCKKCESGLKILETLVEEAEKFSVTLLKINDKRLARISYGIEKFPTLTFFKDGELSEVYRGNLDDPEKILEFLTRRESLILPDKIELVNRETLKMIVEEDKPGGSFVATLIFDDSDESIGVLSKLETIDDEADIFKIRFVRIQDPDLADEFSLESVPALVYFRNAIPLVYPSGADLMDSTEVLEWLIQHQSSILDEDVVESVSTGEELKIMINTLDHLLILFRDKKRKSQKALAALENIDDDADILGVSFIEVDDSALAKEAGIRSFPTLVFFKNSVPSIYEDDLTDTEEVLDWLKEMVEGSDIEEITEEILERLIVKEEKLVVYFHDKKGTDEEDDVVLENLEEIDDDLDERGILFVKVSGSQVAYEYGIEKLPTIVLFENGIPNVYEKNPGKAREVLDWIVMETSGDHTVEVVTNAMLEKMIDSYPHVAVLLYDNNHPDSRKAVDSLETIDHELGKIKLVKLHDYDVVEEYGISSLPALVFFEYQIPHLFSDNLNDGVKVKEWMVDIVNGDHIEEVTDRMLSSIIKSRKYVTVVFYDDSNVHDLKILEELEKVDDDMDRINVTFVRISDRDGKVAEKYGVDIIPGIAFIKKNKSIPYKGQIHEENIILEWVKNLAI
uniref:Thioredoxin domain-containing protein n=1 Tax=Lepeophtheirus salmonis TaxID=72036 RepID=A0A0K2V1A5_LEPSM